VAAKKKTKKVKAAPRKVAKKKVSAKRRPAKRAVAAKKRPVVKRKVAKKPAPPAAPLPPSGPTPPPARRSAPPMHTKVNHPELDDVPDTDARDEVFEIFRTYDRDASGSIDRAEFARLLEALGMEVSEEELAIALDIVDANHSGRISWDEFKAWWSSR